MDRALVVQGLRKTFGARWRRRRVEALRGVSFSIPEGCVAGIVGRNGAGKTTTLRALLGHLRPDGGEIRWPGGIRPSIAWLPEERVLHPKLRPQHYVPLFAPQATESERRKLAEGLHVEALLSRRSGTLSAGQRRRCELFLTIARGASWYFLDEPTAHVDPLELQAIQEVLAAASRSGHTVVVSTHLLREFEEFLDHVVMLDAGRVAVEGETRALCQRLVAFTIADRWAPLDRELVSQVASREAVLTDSKLLVRASKAEEVERALAQRGLRWEKGAGSLHDVFRWWVEKGGTQDVAAKN